MNRVETLKSIADRCLELLPEDIYIVVRYRSGYPSMPMSIPFAKSVRVAGLKKLRSMGIEDLGRGKARIVGKRRCLEALVTLWEHLFYVEIVDASHGLEQIVLDPTKARILAELSEEYGKTVFSIDPSDPQVLRYELAREILRAGAALCLLAGKSCTQQFLEHLHLEIAIQLLLQTKYRELIEKKALALPSS